MYKAQEGFSLIELVVAITILAIIMGLVVPNIWRLATKGRKKATQVAIANVIHGIKEFRDDTGVYPAALSDLKTKPSDEQVARRWDGPYIEKEPNDAWNHPLQYILNPKGTQPPFDLYSWGSNGEGSPEDEWIREEVS